MRAGVAARCAAAVAVLALLRIAAAGRSVLSAAGAHGPPFTCLAKARTQQSKPMTPCLGAPAVAIVHPRVDEFHLFEDLFGGLAALLGGPGTTIHSGAHGSICS